ncbi:MAG: GTP pyrophosphokinase family protein [Myxococcales bacterium]|nr:MAG: GTP pyrophosphokinase family protein [Myxococcales bacterium]
MLKQDLLDEFLARQSSFEAMARSLHDHVQEALERAGMRVLGVSHRVKSASSLARKLARPDRTYRRLDDLTDLVGLRVITYFEDSIEQVAQLIERSFRVDMDRSVDKRLLEDPARFGYRSLHYICHPPPLLIAIEPTWDWPFEIQVRTVLQHAWAEIEHDLGYKSPESIPMPVRRRFSRLAGLLEIADSEFVELRRILGEYALDVRQPHRLPEAALDTLSLQTVTDDEPVTRLDLELAAGLGRPLLPAPFFPDYVLRTLRAARLDRPATLWERLEVFRPQMLPFAERYFHFTREAWGFGSEQLDGVQRGYSLVLLAHWQALTEAELDLHRAERLRGFYQQVDYPDDEAEARRIARLLVHSFGGGRDSSPG